MLEGPQPAPERFDPLQASRGATQHLQSCGYGRFCVGSDTQETDIGRVRLRNLPGVSEAVGALQRFCAEHGYGTRLIDVAGGSVGSPVGNAKALLALMPGCTDPNLEFVFGIAPRGSPALTRLRSEDVVGMGPDVAASEIVKMFAEIRFNGPFGDKAL